MARFRNDTGSVLTSEEFGVLPPGEFDVPGYDPEAHGVIPGCTRLEDELPARKKAGKAADEQDKEPGA
jgi:hypothetical protein